MRPVVVVAVGHSCRAIFAEACAVAGVTVTRAEAGELRPLLARRHPGPAIAAFVDDGKRRVGSPWSRELQDAALAAWSALQAPPPTGAVGDRPTRPLEQLTVQVFRAWYRWPPRRQGSSPTRSRPWIM